MTASIRLRSRDAVADIAPLGAELLAWTVASAPLLWTPQAAIWPDTAPILFPVVGWTRGSRVLVDGATYPLGLHGFARTMPFAVAEHGADHARLVLRSTPESLALYPFAFVFSVAYRLAGNALTVTLTVMNPGSVSMPYACGLHPGFCWPFAGGTLDDYAIVFAEREKPMVPIISADGLFTRRERAVAFDGRRLDLDADVFAREALCFLDAKSLSLRFAHEGGAAIGMEFAGFPHIALWSRPAGRFLSVEAWTGYGDLEDSDGDLRTKPSMIHLAPGESRTHQARYVYSPKDGLNS